MFESILHFIGLCPDSMSHPNLMNLFGLGTLISGLTILLKNKIKIMFNWIKKLL